MNNFLKSPRKIIKLISRSVRKSIAQLIQLRIIFGWLCSEVAITKVPNTGNYVKLVIDLWIKG